MAKLAILIPTIVGREQYLNRLLEVLNKQIEEFKGEVVIFIDSDAGEANGGLTTGAKRNKLVDMAVSYGCIYGAFFDDDDLPSADYIRQQMKVVESGADCGSLWGSIYFSGILGKPFHHSNIYEVWENDTPEYRRCPNHLNCIKLEHFKAVPFPDKTWGEDGVQSELLAKSGLLKTQYEINSVIYRYFTGEKNTPTELNYYNELKAQLGI